MNHWIDDDARRARGAPPRASTLLVINDEEARLLAGERNVVRAARAILGIGRRRVLDQARRVRRDPLLGRSRSSPCRRIPLEEVFDPTGAGDTFAGGLMGYLAADRRPVGGGPPARPSSTGACSRRSWSRTSAAAACATLTRDDVERRYRQFVALDGVLTHVDARSSRSSSRSTTRRRASRRSSRELARGPRRPRPARPRSSPSTTAAPTAASRGCALLAATSRGLRVVRLARNYGQTAGDGGGHRAGARRRSSSPWTPTCRTTPRDIPRLLAALDDDVDVVNGWRRDRKDPWLTRRAAVADRQPHHLGRHRDARSTTTAARCGSCAPTSPRSCGSTARCTASSRRSPPTSGARVVELPVNHRPRTRGRSKYGLVAHACASCSTCSPSSSSPASRPGRSSSSAWSASSCGASGVGLTGVLGFQRLVFGVQLARTTDRAARRSCSIVVGVQFVSIGLLGEMLVRTYHESQAKPIYRVREVRRGTDA